MQYHVLIVEICEQNYEWNMQYHVLIVEICEQSYACNIQYHVLTVERYEQNYACNIQYHVLTVKNHKKNMKGCYLQISSRFNIFYFINNTTNFSKHFKIIDDSEIFHSSLPCYIIIPHTFYFFQNIIYVHAYTYYQRVILQIYYFSMFNVSL